MSVKTFSTEVLTSADTNTYLANSGLVYVTSATVGTGVSSVTVSSAFSATYDNYQIIWIGGTMSNTDSCKLSLGSSVASYSTFMVYGSYATGTVSGAGTPNTNLWNWVGGGNPDHAVVHMGIYGPFLAKWSFFNNNGFYNPNAEMGWSSGVHKVATSYSSFILSPNAGTMTGGTITVYGYRKA